VGLRLVRPGLLQDRAQPEPEGPETGTQKAFRGGGWMDSTTTMRAAMRNGTDPKTKINWMGFRCAQDAKEDAGAKVSLTKE
jgi:sulfatase modifying factor 1